MNKDAKALIEQAIELLNEAQGHLPTNPTTLYDQVQDVMYTLQDLIEDSTVDHGAVTAEQQQEIQEIAASVEYSEQ